MVDLLEGPEEVQQGQCRVLPLGHTGLVQQARMGGWLEAAGGHKLPPNQKCALEAGKVNHALGGICTGASNRARAVIPALSLALTRPCLGSGSTSGLPNTRQRVTEGPTKLEFGIWKERLRDGCAVGEKKALGDFMEAGT